LREGEDLPSHAEDLLRQPSRFQRIRELRTFPAEKIIFVFEKIFSGTKMIFYTTKKVFGEKKKTMFKCESIFVRLEKVFRKRKPIFYVIEAIISSWRRSLSWRSAFSPKRT